ncbi:MAG: thioredoxin 1 [bacterium]|jgi:thioredoxin 1
MSLVHVKDSEFEEKVLKSETPVLVDFWAEWCGPCRSIAPLLEDLAGEFDGKVTIAKVDVDSNPEFAGKFGVRGIPTLILFDKGEKKDMIVGADQNRIRGIVESA